MSQHILTTTEARLLRTISTTGGTSFYELASANELTPSKVSEAISHLIDKRLVEQLRRAPIVELTDEGRSVRYFLKQAKQKYQSREFQRVLVVSDEADEEIQYEDVLLIDAIELLEPAYLDAALDEVIKKIRERKQG